MSFDDHRGSAWAYRQLFLVPKPDPVLVVNHPPRLSFWAWVKKLFRREEELSRVHGE